MSDTTRDLLNKYREEGRLKMRDWTYSVKYELSYSITTYSGELIQECNPNPGKDFGIVRATDHDAAEKCVRDLLVDDDFRVAFCVLSGLDTLGRSIDVGDVNLKIKKKE